MLLSQKLQELKSDLLEDISDEIKDGFNRCIEDAQFLEQQDRILYKIKTVKNEYDQGNSTLSRLLKCIDI